MLARPARATLLLAASLVAALLAAGCGGDDPTAAPADCTPIEGGAVTLVAENLKWDTECLTVPVGTAITFTVDNRDQSVGHNLAISGPSGDAETPIEQGPVTQTLAYEATEKGRHRFVCDPHASMMNGDLWVV